MPALKPETRGLLLKVGVAVLTNGLLKRGLRNQFLHGIAPVAPNMPAMAGPAFTLRFIPAREDIDTIEALRRPDNVQRRALEACPPGGVLVIDSFGSARSASAGDLMIGRLKVRGCAGIVTDGGFRDIAGVIKVGLPAYQRRLRHRQHRLVCTRPISTYPSDARAWRSIRVTSSSVTRTASWFFRPLWQKNWRRRHSRLPPTTSSPSRGLRWGGRSWTYSRRPRMCCVNTRSGRSPADYGAPRGARAFFIGGNGNRASGSSRDNLLAKEI